MGEKRQVLYLALGAVLLIGLLGASQAAVVAQTPDAQPSPAATGVSGGVQGASGTPEPTAAEILPGVLEPRTPEPTDVPGRIQIEVNQFAVRVGLTSTEFLGLSAADWITLGISLLFVLAGYLFGTLLIRLILPGLARRSRTRLDDDFLAQAGSELRWLIVLILLNFGTKRLALISAGLKTILADVYFVLGLLLAFRIVSMSLGLAERWYRRRYVETSPKGVVVPDITLLVRGGRVVVALIGLLVLLSHFGVNVLALSAALGLGGLAFSLAAKDTLACAIAGIIILVDQPFRIGDQIEIQGVGTWGDVTDIGLRTTRIRIGDNRMVIVPNSVIGANQVINYTYPDPHYRIETRVGIAHGTDIERAREVIVEAVRQVEGVLPDKPVDALYAEMGDWATVFRVRWWIQSVADSGDVQDRVHTALQHALDEAQIERPSATQSVSLRSG